MRATISTRRYEPLICMMSGAQVLDYYAFAQISFVQLQQEIPLLFRLIEQTRRVPVEL